MSLFLTVWDGCFLNELENLDESDFCTDLSLAVSLSWFLFKKVDCSLVKLPSFVFHSSAAQYCFICTPF